MIRPRQGGAAPSVSAGHELTNGEFCVTAGPPVGTKTTLFFREGLRDRIVTLCNLSAASNEDAIVRLSRTGMTPFCHGRLRDRPVTSGDRDAAPRRTREPDDRGLDDAGPFSRGRLTGMARLGAAADGLRNRHQAGVPAEGRISASFI